MQTNIAVSDRKDSDEMHLADLALSTTLPIATDLGIAHAAMTKRLHNVFTDLVALKHASASEAHGRSYELAIASLVDTLWGGRAATDEQTAKRMELDADCAEDHIEGVMAIEGETPVLLDQHAAMLEKQAVTSRVRARFQRKKARSIRNTRVVARQRVGLGGAA